MGGSACVIIINGNKAYAAVEDLADKYRNININMLEASITASCNVVPYVSLYLKIENGYLIESLTQPIIDIHARIINELPLVEKSDAQKLVDELAELLFAASEQVATIIEDEPIE